MKSKTAIYVRCSTAQQNLEVQLKDLTRYANARNLEIVEVFEDHGISGNKDRRPALDQMMKLARQRKFTFLLVWRLDRLGRNTRHLLTLIDEFEQLQISLVSFQEGFDLSTSFGRAMATILSALASFEREIIRERVISGIKNAKAKGVRFGRPCFIDKEKIRELRNQGWTYSQISRKLGVSPGSIREAVRK